MVWCWAGWFGVWVDVFAFGFSCVRCVWFILVDLFGFAYGGLLLFCLVVGVWVGFCCGFVVVGGGLGLLGFDGGVFACLVVLY